MTEPDPDARFERIDLNQAEDPTDVVHRAVEVLARGESLGLSLGGLNGLAASALHPDAVERLGRPTPSGAVPGSPCLWLRGGDEVADWVPSLTPLGSRLARRAWPGPLSLVYPLPTESSLFGRLSDGVASYLFVGGEVALQVPRHPFVRDVLRLLPGPLVFRSFPRGVDFADGFPLLIESDPDAAGHEVTVVRVERGSWSVVTAGSIDEPALGRMAGTLVLFVCTGNTCRSPMAEAICKVLLAERLGCRADELESRGYVILSAGIAAVNGMAAASNAIEVVKDRGGSLAEHKSRKLTLDLVRQADWIVAMTGDHLEALLDHVPEVAPRARLLHPQGHDVSDPVGADRETYRRTASAIESYLTGLLDAIVSL